MGLKDINQKNIEELFKRYDEDKDGTLRFSEFSHMFDPIQQEHSKYLFERKPVSLKQPFKEHMFSYKAKNALLEFIKAILKAEKEHS